MALKKQMQSETRVANAVVACGHTGCSKPAVVKINLPKAGWTNLCESHHSFHVEQEAKAWCEAHGLKTKEDMREFIRTRKDKIGKVMP